MNGNYICSGKTVESHYFICEVGPEYDNNDSNLAANTFRSIATYWRYIFMLGIPLLDSYILAIHPNVGHTTVRYRMIIPVKLDVMSEENRSVTLKRSPYSDKKDACTKQRWCGIYLCKWA